MVNQTDVPVNLTVDQHVFSLYFDQVSSIAQRHTVLDMITLPVTHDTIDLVQRITAVLRLTPGDYIILFDRMYHMLCSIVKIEHKQHIEIQIHKIEPNRQLQPPITWLLPVLKRDAFEEAIYVLTELGVQHIQPFVAKKTHRAWGGEKELDRCRRIMVAAAEQSKQFIIPTIQAAVTFEQCFVNNMYRQHLYRTRGVDSNIVGVREHQVTDTAIYHIFFDQQGKSLRTIVQTLEQQPIAHIIACSGPEGDLTYQEKLILAEHNFTFCKLTNTVLRAQQAITIGLGVFRSLLEDSIKPTQNVN